MKFPIITLSTILAGALLMGGLAARATTYYATNASYWVVSSNVALASPGDAVIIAPGTGIWSNTLTLNGVSLQGSGTNGASGTTLVDEENRSVSAQMIVANPVAGYELEISQIQFSGTNAQTSDNYIGALQINGTNGTTWRVDHNVFNGLYAKGIDTYGNSFCVIDHNTFYERLISIADNDAYPDDNEGALSWSQPPTYGLDSSNVLYVEDNYFTNLIGNPASVGACDGDGGSRVVFRYNTIWNDQFDNHGTETPGLDRSERSFEIYNNSFNYSSAVSGYNDYGIAFIRGGSGVIYSNTATGYARLIDLRYYRYTDTYGYNVSPWYPYGGANGTNNWDSNSPSEYASGTSAAGPGVSYLYDSSANWSPNEWAGYILNNTSSGLFAPITSNTANTIYFVDDSSIIPNPPNPPMTFNNGDGYAIHYVYAALDQPGRGSGDYLKDVSSSTNAIVIDTNTGTVSWPNEVLEGIYCWSNSVDGAMGEMSSSYPELREGVDFYNDTPKPGYAPFVYPHPLDTSSSGGSGLAAWWKLDEGSGTTAYDSSGNTNDGTFGGSTPPEWVNGQLYFSGAGYVMAGTNDIPTTYPITVSYWVNYGSGGGGTVISRLLWGSAGDWRCDAVDSFMNVGNDDDAYLSFGTAIDDNNWHLVAETVTANTNGTGTASMYLDGSLEQSSQYGSYYGPPAGTSTTSIGIQSDYASTPFTGYIADIRIYTSALSSSNIEALYTNGPVLHVSDITNGLVGWWKFDDGSGTTAHDSSGNGNDGTLGGSTLPVWTNSALYFNGSSYISAGTNNVPITYPISVSYWVNFTSGGGGAVVSRLLWGSEADWRCDDADGFLNVGGGNIADVSFTNTIDDGTWHLVTETVVDNGNGTGTAYIYLDGNAISSNASGTSYGPNVGTSTISIGVQSDYASTPFTGLMDDVRIYNRTLSDSEIQTLYSNGRQ
jgi:hypothetical protein